MEYIKYNFKNLILEAEANKIVLPNFQRPYVWDLSDQTQLLASFLVRLPIGTFLMLEGESDSFHSQELCFKNTAEPTGSDCKFLLDGQQRMSTIKNIFFDHLGFGKWEECIRARNLYSALQYRWFLKIENSPLDLFGFDKLRFDETDPDNITNVEPGDVIDSIVKFKILLGSRDHHEFYHPASVEEEETEFAFHNKFIRECAAKQLIPLFHVVDEQNNRILHQTLKSIAQYQVEVLKNLVDNKKADPGTYLGHLDPKIDDKYYDTTSYLKESESLWSSIKETWVEDVRDYFNDLFREEIRVPKLKASELARATSVFEYMNKGGTPLDTFDIMVAKYAGPQQSDTLYTILSDLMQKPVEVPISVSKQSKEMMFTSRYFDVYKKDSVARVVKDQYLNLISVFHAIESLGIEKVSLVHTKKDYLLKLKRQDIDQVLSRVNRAMSRVLVFFQFRCGFDSINRLNYKLMLLPIAVALENDDVWKSRLGIDRAEFWFWSSLFSGRYREKQNARVIDDIKWICRFVTGAAVPEIENRSGAMFAESKYNDLETLLHDGTDEASAAAIQTGLHLFVLKKQPSDFTKEGEKLIVWQLRNGHFVPQEGNEDVDQKPEVINLQDHHIVPIATARTLHESSKKIRKEKGIRMINSPLNRVLISAKANQRIGGMAFEDYSEEINENVGWSQMIPEDFPSDARSIARDSDELRRFLTARFRLIEGAIKRELQDLLQS
jgi:hypothetical protein